MAQQSVQGSYLVEGYTGETSKATNDWIKLRSAMQNNMILQGELIGIQEFSVKKKKSTDEPLYSAMIDFNGITGYIPLEEMSVKPMTLNKLRNRVGTIVRFTVIRCMDEDEDNERYFIASRKKAQEIAIETTFETCNVGDVVKASVLYIGVNYLTMDVGGVETIMPVAETSHGWVDDLSLKFRTGDVIDVKILKMNKDEKTLAVSRKAMLPDPWLTVAKRFKVQGEYKAKVSGVVENGVYINLAEGVDAFAKHLRYEQVQRGEDVLVRILNVNTEKQNIVARIVKRL